MTPKPSGVKQPFYYVHECCGLGIQAGHREAGLCLEIQLRRLGTAKGDSNPGAWSPQEASSLISLAPGLEWHQGLRLAWHLTVSKQSLRTRCVASHCALSSTPHTVAQNSGSKCQWTREKVSGHFWPRLKSHTALLLEHSTGQNFTRFNGWGPRSHLWMGGMSKSLWMCLKAIAEAAFEPRIHVHVCSSLEQRFPEASVEEQRETQSKQSPFRGT